MPSRKRDRILKPLPRDGERLEMWAWQQHRRHRQQQKLQFTRQKPKDRQTAVFLRWQQMRKARFFKLLPATDATRFCTCACGHPKECSKSMCYECQDMRKLVRQRIPIAGAIDVEERYGKVYETPFLRHDVDYRSSRFEDSENLGGLHNVIRALEECGSYD